jgi:hypothetical protein
MVTIKGKYEIADLKAAQNLHARMGRLARAAFYFMIGAMILVVLFGVWFLTKGSTLGWTFVVFPSVVGGFMAAYWYWLRPYQITRSYNQHKELASPFEIELNEEGYSIKNSYGSGKVPWKDFTKWKVDDKIFLLYRTDTMFNMIPRRLLQDEADVQYLLNQLRENNVKESYLVRNPVMSLSRIIVWLLMGIAIIVVIYLNTRNTP